MTDLKRLLDRAMLGQELSEQQALSLAGYEDTSTLVEAAAALRDLGHRNVITYSRKVFIPLTHLCRDVCAGTVSPGREPGMSGGAVYLGREAGVAIQRSAQRTSGHGFCEYT